MLLPKKKYLKAFTTDFDIVLALVQLVMPPTCPEHHPVVARMNELTLLRTEMLRRGWDVAPADGYTHSSICGKRGITLQWMPADDAKRRRLERAADERHASHSHAPH